MTNGADSHSHVSRIHQRNDNTVEVHVQTASFTPGQEVEVSGYLTQGNTYAAFNDKKHIPLPDSPDPKQPAVLHVQLPAMDLKPDEDVTVVTRVAEVWPTVLQQDSEIVAEYVGQGLKAAWTAKDPWGKGPGGPASPSPGNWGGGATTNPPS
jgi:hypothetical protein